MTFPTHAFSSTSSANLVNRTFSRRDLIPLEPDALWKITWGAVRTLTWNDEGTAIALGYWGPGDVVGQPLSRIQPYQVECLTSVEVSYVPFHQRHQVLDAIFLHAQQAEELLSIVRHERMHCRLQQLLAWLAQKFGRQVSTGRLIDLRLTHQAIAEAVGTTRVTVTRTLNQFEREGVISRPKRHFIVLCDRYSGNP
jgi:CRP-like cAMP-binding protein